MVVEGQTELGFVDTVLKHHLAGYEVYTAARCVETSRNRRNNKIYRGGLVGYSKLKNDIDRWQKQDQHEEVYFTTMVDLYGLPEDFPQYYQRHKYKDPYRLVNFLERAMSDDINHPRFIPYIQLHEFEALLLTDPIQFSSTFIESETAIKTLMADIAGIKSPELINHGNATSPSKRIIKVLPEYADQKATVGPVIAEKIGLTAIRQVCPHFDQWLTMLEQLEK